MLFYARLLGIIIGLVIGGTLGFWIYDNDIPSKNIVSSLDSNTVEPGGYLTQSISLDRSRICYVDTERLLYDSNGTRYILPSVTSTQPGNLGHDEYKQEIKIPDTVLPGPAMMFVYTKWSCNPLEYIFPIKGNYQELHFEIIPKKT